MTPTADAMYAEAITTFDPLSGVSGTNRWGLRSGDGTITRLNTALRRWCGQLDEVDRELLALSSGPLLDVGCGPGRFVSAATRNGQVSLGVDIVETAVHLARRDGGAVLHRSVFDRLPGEGRWGTVLLADGNIGIGGDPVRLLSRCRELLAPDGQVITELDFPDGMVRRTQVRIESGEQVSRWFDWATVAADAIDSPAQESGLTVRSRWRRGERWFAALTH